MKRIRQELSNAFPLTQFARLGVELTQAEELHIATVQQAIDEATACVRRACACVRTILKSKALGYQRPPLEQLAEKLSEVAKLTYAHRPLMVCPACKRIPAVSVECATCFGAGYAMYGQRYEIELALLDVDNPVVRYRGKLVPVEKVK